MKAIKDLKLLDELYRVYKGTVDTVTVVKMTLNEFLYVVDKARSYPRECNFVKAGIPIDSMFPITLDEYTFCTNIQDANNQVRNYYFACINELTDEITKLHNDIDEYRVKINNLNDTEE
jgi:hypothetical protein